MLLKPFFTRIFGKPKKQLPAAAPKKTVDVTNEWIRHTSVSEMPGFEGAYGKSFLKLKIASTSFIEACKAQKKDPAQAFRVMFEKFNNSPEPIWVKARQKFIEARKQIAETQYTPEKKIMQERRTLERIFAGMLASKK